MPWRLLLASISLTFLVFAFPLNKASAQSTQPPAAGCWYIGSVHPNNPSISYSCNLPEFGPVYDSNTSPSNGCTGSGSATGNNCCASYNATCTGVQFDLARRADLYCCPNPVAPPPPPPPPSPSPSPVPFSCTDQFGLSFACFTSSCPANWVSSVQNPNTTCASSGQTCCWYNPPAPPSPTPTPDCDSGIVCGSCNLATSGNYCSNNGIRSCTYTTYTGGGTCNQVAAPSQTCSTNNCFSGYICQNGSCTQPTQTCTPDGTCNAPTPACGTTTSGTDNCGNPCIEQGSDCEAPTCNFDSGYNLCCASGYSQYVNAGTWSDGSGDCWDTGPCNQVDASCGNDPPPPGAKYKCSGTACIRDDTNGSYTSSTCNNACGDGTTPPPDLQLPDLVCRESISSDNGATWSNTVTANPGQQVNFKMVVSNSGEGIPWYGTRNKFDEMIGGYTNIWQNTVDPLGGVFWLIKSSSLPGIYWDDNYYEWGSEFCPGCIDTTNWREVLSSNAQSFKNLGYAVYSGNARPWRFNGNYNNRCWPEPESGGQTCLNIAAGCNPSWVECPYTMYFQCNAVTVNTFYPVSGWVKNSQTKVGLPNVEIQVYDNDLALPPPQKTKTATTDATGRFIVDNFVRGGDSYAVRVTGNLANPKTAPTGYAPPAKTSTIGWTWNWALNPNPPNNPQADTPLGSLSYEGQKAGSGIDCSGPNGAGTGSRCSFVYDPLTNDAQYVSQTCPPPKMTPGQTASVSVTMKNTGNTTWTTNNLYRLGSQNYQDNTFWGLNRILLGAGVPPGNSNAFNRTVTAPAAAGAYNFQWRMTQDKVEWFGQTTPNCPVTVGTSNPGGANTPWIQTTGGDVHSNTRINTPGGP